MNTTDDLATARDVADRLRIPEFRDAMARAGYVDVADLDIPQLVEALAASGYYMTPELARNAAGGAIPGWNVRCNRCGTYGATWTAEPERPGWGSLALCHAHAVDLDDEHRRHDEALSRFRAVNFEQVRRPRRANVRRDSTDA